MVISPTVYDKLPLAFEEKPPVLAITVGVSIWAFESSAQNSTDANRYIFFIVLVYVIKVTVFFLLPNFFKQGQKKFLSTESADFQPFAKPATNVVCNPAYHYLIKL